MPAELTWPSLRARSAFVTFVATFETGASPLIELTITPVILNDPSPSFKVRLHTALISLVLLPSLAFELGGLHLWQDAVNSCVASGSLLHHMRSVT
jgi:hypothetical protein